MNFQKKKSSDQWYITMFGEYAPYYHNKGILHTLRQIDAHNKLILETEQLLTPS